MAGTGISANDPSTIGTSSSPTFPDTSSRHDTGTQIVLPVTGGAPVVAIPIGGDLYLPATGGPPIVGISTSP